MTDLTEEQKTAMREVFMQIVEKAHADHPDSDHMEELRSGMHKFLSTLLFGLGHQSIENAGEEAKITMGFMKEIKVKRVN